MSEKDKEPQIPLFDKGEWWEEHWKGMPEYVSKDLTAFKTLLVHLETRKDMEAFSALVRQRVDLTTKFIWYPEAEIGRVAHMRYVDAVPEKNLNSDVETLDES